MFTKITKGWWKLNNLDENKMPMKKNADENKMPMRINLIYEESFSLLMKLSSVW